MEFNMPMGGKLAIIAATAGAFFALGAYYQHLHVARNIRNLEEHNPHAYLIRRKLYGLLDVFKMKQSLDETCGTNNASIESHKLGGIMKYGFPSMNEISLNETFNFVTSFDRRNSAIQWMCERIVSSSLSSFSNANRNQDLSLRPRARRDALFEQSEAGRVFFMSNIKPFLSRGFNGNVWNRLLHYIHDKAQIYGNVYVYTGSIYLPRKMKSNNWYLECQSEENTIITVPTHFFKIVIVDQDQLDGRPFAEAYVLPNMAIDDNIDLQSLLSDIRDIENATGLKFFDGLDRNFLNTRNQALPSHNIDLSVSRFND